MSLLPLDTWFELMGFNRWHAWGFADNDALAVTESCDPVLFEDATQIGGALGRADIREAIDGAEAIIHEYARFWPAPKFYEVEAQYGRLDDRRFARSGPWDEDSRWHSLRLRDDSWVADAGIEGLTLIQGNAPTTLVDVNGDGYYEYFQVGPIATTLTESSEIALYFTSGDRWDGTEVGDSWRIEPIQASILGGQLIIRGRPWLIGLPVLSIGITPQRIDPTDPASFAASLDVYRRFVDHSGTLTTNSQAVVYWETRPCHGWWCMCGGSCCSCTTDPFTGAVFDPRATASATARVALRDGRRGIVAPAEAAFNTVTGTWEGFPTTICWEPDRVLLRLYAGYPLDHGRMDKRLRDAVARLTAAEMQQEICGCAEAQRRVMHWQQDLSKTGADKQTFATTETQLNNPLGTRRGHWYAWNVIADLGRVSGKRAG